MKAIQKVFGRNHIKGIVITMAAVVMAVISVTGCSSLEENDKGTAIVSISEADAEERLAQYEAAIKKAEYYDNILNLSRATTVEKLMTIDGYSEEVADFAVDSINASWRDNALRKAQRYKDAYYMSDIEIYYMLIDPRGENFTVEEADYAMINLS